MKRLSPYLFQGVWDARLRTRWSMQKRHCAHPYVYVEALRELLRRLGHSVRHSSVEGGQVDYLTLATDSADAAPAFAHEAPNLGLRLQVRQWDRSRLTILPSVPSGADGSPSGHGRKRAIKFADRKARWIEFRDDLEPAVVVSALEDLRMLARGAAFVGSMCSSFHTLAWNLAVALQGEVIPYESVDGCVPHLEVWPSLTGTTNDYREPRGLPTFTAETLRGGPSWHVGGGRSSRYPYYQA